MDWLILILGVPAILIPLLLLFGFAGCSAGASECTEDSNCPSGTHCDDGLCVADDPPFALSAPQNLAAIALDDQSVSLTWTTADPATTDFGIERAEEAGEFEEILPENLSNLSPTGATDSFRLQPAVTYTYRFRADPLDTSQATVFPAVPANLLATPAKIDQIKVSWDNASAIATDYILEHRPSGGTFGEIFRGPDTTFTHSNDPTLVEGSRHQYRVSAIVDPGVENDVPQDGGVKSATSAIASTTLAFTDAFTAILTDDEPGDEGFCLVQRLNKALLTVGGTHTQVRIVLRGSTTGSLTLDRVTISQPAASGNAYDAGPDLTDVITSPVTIPPNTPVTLGPVDYALNNTQDLLVAFDISNTTGEGNLRFRRLATATSFSNPATAEAGIPNRTPNYQFPGTDFLYLIEKIQVL